MKPYIGQTCLVHGRNHGGNLEHPAIITQVKHDGSVFVTLMPHGCAPYAVTYAIPFKQEVSIGDSTDMVAYPIPVAAEDEEPIPEEETKEKPNGKPGAEKSNK